MKQSARTFVEKLDFVTSAGHLTGGDSRQRAGLRGRGPVAVITDLCVMEPDEQTKELKVTQLHPGITQEDVRKATGWDIKFSADCRNTSVPTTFELLMLRDLQQRTALAHSKTSAI